MRCQQATFTIFTWGQKFLPLPCLCPAYGLAVEVLYVKQAVNPYKTGVNSYQKQSGPGHLKLACARLDLAQRLALRPGRESGL